MTCACMLVTDLDGTLLGDETALDRFIDWHRSMRRVLRLVYTSGRFVADIRRLIGQIGIPEPDAIIGGVGTQIEQFQPRQLISGWCEPTSLTWSESRIRSALATFAELQLQPAEFQSTHKVSYFAGESSPYLVDRIQATLGSNQIAAEVIYSSRRDIDILPQGVHKGSSAEFLRNLWRIPARRVIVFGDSGNDQRMFQQGFLGVIVGNAQPELWKLRGPDIYRSRQKFADGMLEGLAHWLPSIDQYDSVG